jgi:GntR family transcriptional regulator
LISFSVKIQPGIPVYEQVVYAAKKAIVKGQLRPGDRFPSVREMSKELKINPNTALKIVNRLVDEKLLEIRPGIGSIVSELGISSKAERDQILKNEAEKLVIESKRLSIKKDELLQTIERLWDQS